MAFAPIGNDCARAHPSKGAALLQSLTPFGHARPMLPEPGPGAKSGGDFWSAPLSLRFRGRMAYTVPAHGSSVAAVVVTKPLALRGWSLSRRRQGLLMGFRRVGRLLPPRVAGTSAGAVAASAPTLLGPHRVRMNPPVFTTGPRTAEPDPARSVSGFLPGINLTPQLPLERGQVVCHDVPHRVKVDICISVYEHVPQRLETPGLNLRMGLAKRLR